MKAPVCQKCNQNEAMRLHHQNRWLTIWSEKKREFIPICSGCQVSFRPKEICRPNAGGKGVKRPDHWRKSIYDPIVGSSEIDNEPGVVLSDSEDLVAV